jgi:heavy metal sensor kinase
MKQSRSIRFKLITFYVCLLTLVFICFGAYIYVVFHQLLVSSLEQILSRRATQIAITILDELPVKGDAYVATEIQARYAPELNERVIRIGDSRGKEIYASKNASLMSNYPSLADTSASGKDSTFWKMISHEGDRYRFVGLVHRVANGKTYLVEVGAPEDSINNALTDLIWTLLIGFPVLIGLSIFGGYSLLGRALRPVDKIVSAAEHITFKDRNQRLPVPATGDEFERISEALNRMIERLDESFQLANRFAGDASHELRTPLTILQGELEVFVNDRRYPDEAIEVAGNMLEEVGRLSRIVEGLLLVSRLDAGEAQMKLERVDLGKMVRSVAEQMQPLCEVKMLDLKYQFNEEIVVVGDEIRLRQVVVNLLDNAIKYTPEGGSILLRVGADRPTAFLEIVDTGMGISRAALPQVFERFFRSEEARASRRSGTGLGLAIVKSIIEAHRGTVHVESNESQGTKVRVELNVAEAESIKGKDSI